MASLRDLRDYGDSTAVARATSEARGSIGLERELALRTTVIVTPTPVAGAEGTPSPWLRPRAELIATYDMRRDPNNQALTENDSVLARRLGNTQTLLAAAVFDPAPLTAGSSDGLWAQLSRIVRPIDVSVSRSLVTAFDASPFGATAGYVFGFGSLGALRDLHGVPAASAGSSWQYSLAHVLEFPGGIAVTNRAQRTDSRNYFARIPGEPEVTLVDGVQVALPDIGVRWSASPTAFGGWFTNLSANARVSHTRQTFESPLEFVGGLPGAERRAIHLRSYPLGLSAVTARGEVSLQASLATTFRTDTLPGAVTRARGQQISVDLGKPFALPSSWRARSPLRARASFQETTAHSEVSNVAVEAQRSRLSDNGRRVIALSADADIASDMTFGLQASQLVSFDRNFNRRFTQTVLSAVLELKFFGGSLR
jgi:hypothetical protein